MNESDASPPLDPSAATEPPTPADVLTPPEADNSVPHDPLAAESVPPDQQDLVLRDSALVAPEFTVAPVYRESLWVRMGRELVVGVQTLLSAAVYATLIVTFGVQVARVDGLSMAPTLEDHDRLIVNKLVYELGEPRPGDIVMLYYPLNPEKMFVKRVIAQEGDTVRIEDGHVYVNDCLLYTSDAADE